MDGVYAGNAGAISCLM